ncbi:dATP/dGTP diphosphohydrolase domain-containing protein [Ectopseudomonas composti]|uniref:dATP/dGTP diphosphohydrolase domain-containing protein n=1 Tax=Ectopseudomonas composti TaxID=658457 RepID=UPI000773C1D1|nr:dATP/dGTP diphosphohydrolase domain-containing protein [Pseudomonas composti]
MTDTKPTNPKDAIGSGKLPIHLWPTTATAMGSLGLLDGMLKYGRSNWRASGVRASIYFDAANRHLNAWFEGEDCDPDSGLPHLAHALACLAIVVDAQAAGKLNDDRMHPGGYRALLTDLTGHVSRLKDLHAGKSPQHYTISSTAEGK